MWLVAGDSAGKALSYARGDFVINASTYGCQPTGNNYIQAENTKPGAPKSAWQINPAAFVPATFSGYANAESYACGNLAYFKLNSQLSSLATARSIGWDTTAELVHARYGVLLTIF